MSSLTPRKIYEDEQFMILKFVYDSGVCEVFVFNKKSGDYVSIDTNGNSGNC